MVLGANTFRQFVQMLTTSTVESGVRDPWVSQMRALPTTVISSTLKGPEDWPEATIATGDAVDIVARLKEESDVPLRSHGSLSSCATTRRPTSTIYSGRSPWSCRRSRSPQHASPRRQGRRHLIGERWPHPAVATVRPGSPSRPGAVPAHRPEEVAVSVGVRRCGVVLVGEGRQLHLPTPRRLPRTRAEELACGTSARFPSRCPQAAFSAGDRPTTVAAIPTGPRIRSVRRSA